MNVGWKVLKASCSSMCQGLHVVGQNFETTDPLFSNFYWHISRIDDDRYDFSGCLFADEPARECYERLVNKRKRS